MHHILVTEFNEDRIRSHQGQAFVVRTQDPYALNHIANVVGEHNKLHCIALEHHGRLSSLPFQESWQGLPISLFCTSFGSFMDLAPMLGLLRSLSVRVFLSTDVAANTEGVQILASLGISTGIYFGEKTIDWDSLNDLCHYAVYGKMPHAAVEPFQYTVSQYDPGQHTDFASVYFNKPERYLHLGTDNQLALTQQHLQKGRFLVDANLETIHEHPDYQQCLVQWQDHFMAFDTCSKCAGWRVCLGKFAHQLDTGAGCQQLFADLTEACDFHRTQQHNAQQNPLCQL